MSVLLFFAAVGLGVVIGVQLGLVLVELRDSSARAQRLAAVRRAEARVQDVQAAALHGLADVTERVADLRTARTVRPVVRAQQGARNVGSPWEDR